MKSDNFLKCVVDDNRRNILLFIDKEEKSVNEIVDYTNLEQSLVSHHLYQLKCCGLVKSRQSGKKILYKVSRVEIIDILKEIEHVSTKIKSRGECDR